MNDLASEFQAISDLYVQIASDLSSAISAVDPDDSHALAASILQRRDCLARIEQMDSRVHRLVEEWKKQRSTLDSKSGRELDCLAEIARGHALRLNQLCNLPAQKLEATRERLGRNLAELGKGSRYLKSFKPASNNFPKFIDSLY